MAVEINTFLDGHFKFTPTGFPADFMFWAQKKAHQFGGL
jgi:hypothetical protein